MHANINPFDIIMAIILIVGVIRGRKRGISEELLDVLDWIAIVIVCALAYRPLGKLLAGTASLPLYLCDVISYILIALIIMFLGKSLKRAVGEKLVQGDAFGRFEYYLGMMAGALRFFCVTLMLLAFLHAKYSTPAERLATAKMQQENFGTITFPTIESIQQTVFYESVSGKLIREHLNVLLIQPVPPTNRKETPRQRRERAVDEIMK